MKIQVWKTENEMYIEKSEAPSVDPRGDGVFILDVEHMATGNVHEDMLLIYAGRHYGLEDTFVDFRPPDIDESGALLAEYDGDVIKVNIEDCIMSMDEAVQRDYFRIPQDFE